MELNYKVFGEGDPVIILHGLFGMLDNWQTFAKGLAEDYMVYLVDQRDHGKSPHTDEFNYTLLAEDLSQFMEDNWIHEARLIGHSMGGKTVMQFAYDYPDMVEQMVVVDIAPKTYEPGHELIFKALRAVDIDAVTSRKEVEDILSKYIDQPGVRLFLMKNLQRRKEGGFRWKMNLELLYIAYPKILADTTTDGIIEVDTLFVKGEHSKYISGDAEEKIAQKYSQYKIHQIDDAGHWVHADKPKELLSVVQEFFSKM